MNRMVAAAATALACLAPAPAAAQAPQNATLIVTVTDPSGAVIRGATVTIAANDEAPRVAVPPLSTSAAGTAAFAPVKPGRYTVTAEFPGFDIGVATGVRVESGENRQAIILPLKRVQESVTVGRSAQDVAADRRADRFTMTLDRADIDALPDDPADLVRQLSSLAGGNVAVRVNGFIGAPVPAKAQIASIRIVRDQFAAENHSASADEVEIITKPGNGPLEGSLTWQLRDGSMNARSPFAPEKGPERVHNYQAYLAGTLIERRASFSLSGSLRRAFDTPLLNVALPDGTRAEALGLRRTNDQWSVYALLDSALTGEHAMRISYNQDETASGNLGVGAFDLPERARSATTRVGGLWLQESGPLGARTFINSRAQFSWTTVDAQPAVEAPTIRVNGAFTAGGAQVAGSRRSRQFEIASDIDHTRGRHALRAGGVVDVEQVRSDQRIDYLGTYTFAGLATYWARTPASYTQQLGDPRLAFWNATTGFYLQDDVQIGRSVTLSPGVRYEVQTHLHDHDAVVPRLGVTWAPFASGRTTVRGSVGVFLDWLEARTYEETVRTAGSRVMQVAIADPSYPIGAVTGGIVPSMRYLLGDTLSMERTGRVSAGIAQVLAPRTRLNVVYSATRASDLFRGRDSNAPVGGIRPDPTQAGVIEVVSDARATWRRLLTTLSQDLSRGGPSTGQPLVDWRRTRLTATYIWSSARNNTDGPFGVPASGDLSREWGPAPNDRRHLLVALLSTQAIRHVNASLVWSASSGTPYDVTTGFDDNGDTFFNDRPAGVGRNSRRSAPQGSLEGRLSWTIPRDRYRLSFTVSVTNLTNRPSYTGYSGVLTSPFFGQPTAVVTPRKVDVSLAMSF